MQTKRAPHYHLKLGIFYVFIDWLLWDRVPDLFTWVGILLVCTGGIWTLRYSRAISPSTH